LDLPTRAKIWWGEGRVAFTVQGRWMLLGLYTPALHKSALQNVFILDPCMIAAFKEAYAVAISLCKTLCKFRGYRYIFDPLLVLPLVSYPNSLF